MNDRGRFERLLAGIGIVAAALLLLSFVLSPEQFFHSYLLGFWAWWSLVPGALAILMLHDLTGGRWGEEIRRFLRPMVRTLPLLALFFLPIAFGLQGVYPWARPGGLSVEEKLLYLAPPVFLLRAAVYFGVFIALAFRVTSKRQGRRPIQSALGLILYVIVVTFATIDWLMSLDPQWISTGFGLRIVVTQALGALALILLIRHFVRQPGSTTEPPSPSPSAPPAVRVDLGNLLLAFVMLWAYLAFTEFLIIWSGNLPEEIGWYLARFRGGFQWLAVSLVVFHFAVPFLLLLIRELKKRVGAVALVAAGLLALHFLDSFWLVAPAYQNSPLPHWPDFAALVALGALLLAWFFRELRKEPLRNA